MTALTMTCKTCILVATMIAGMKCSLMIKKLKLPTSTLTNPNNPHSECHVLLSLLASIASLVLLQEVPPRPYLFSRSIALQRSQHENCLVSINVNDTTKD